MAGVRMSWRANRITSPGTSAHPWPTHFAPSLDTIRSGNAVKEVTVTGTQRDALQRLSDPMRLMRLFAVANETGGEEEVRGYLWMEGHLSAVASNESTCSSRARFGRRWTWPARFFLSPLLRAVERAPHSNPCDAPIEVPPTPSPAPVADAAPVEVALPTSPYLPLKTPFLFQQVPGGPFPARRAMPPQLQSPDR